MANTEREIRIAVVMYGGTSLAIYMNGISQEFLQLVRATSPAATDDVALRGTASVYRKLAHVLSGTPIDQITDTVLAEAPRVRFVIDILSGTSAGGINSVMLAKALARNTDLEPLKELWLTEGAIGNLINDRHSASPRYPYREPIRSAFNSDRMFVELLNAIERLNPAVDSSAEPLVSDIALAVTGTDLDGNRVDIRLADGIAQEYDHKETFDFRLSWPEIDEFTPDHDPLLAFAARTTSSLPAVFEPTTVSAARELSGKERARRAPWPLLFRSLRDEDREDHEGHAFADGGYLDNKPFGHAIDLLARAKSGVHVTRKLYYLEPQPQRIDPDAPLAGTPNALAASVKGVTLARYETIRSDIERLAERNRLLDRVRTLGLGVLEDLANLTPEPLEAGADLRAHTAAYGPGYGGYHRLRVATLTDVLADTLADYARVAPASDLRRAIRLVVRAWRNAHFARDAADSRQPESEFLRRFDVPFHRRRAVFFLNKINQLFHLDDTVAMELENVTGKGVTSVGAFPIITALLADHRGDGEARARAEAAWLGMEELLRTAKTLAQRAVVALDSERQTPNDASELRSTLEGHAAERLHLLRGELRRILERDAGVDAEEAVRGFLAREGEMVDDLAARLEAHQRARIDTALDALSDLQRLPAPAGLESEVRALLELYWDCFLYFDMIQFPLVEATGVGDELSPIEIHRMSPADCHHYDTLGSDKLMGTKFASFGAFLDRRWRESDIRWGRLDGAERLITTLLGREHGAAREQLVVEAHLAILEQEFPEDRASIEALAVRRNDAQGRAALDATSTRRNTERFLTERKVDPELDPRASASSLSRLVRTTNKLADTLTTESKAPRALSNAIALTSLTGSELLDAAIPKSFKHLLVSYWANLLLLFGFLLLVLAFLLPGDSWFRADTRLGFVLIAIALLGLFVRSMLWRALAPPAVGDRAAAAVASRRIGGAALLLGLVVIVANGLLERSSAWGDQQYLLGYPTAALALEFARTGGEVACVLGDSTVTPGCVAPSGAPTRPAVDHARGLIYVDFAFIVLYVSLLVLLGLAAIRASALALGSLAMALALTAGALDVIENVRILQTLAMDYALMLEPWLVETTQIARAKFLAVFVAVAVLLPTLSLHARTSLLNLRIITWILTSVGVVGVALGLLGLVIGAPTYLSFGLGLLVAVMLGIAVMFMAGHITVPVRVRTDGTAPILDAPGHRL